MEVEDTVIKIVSSLTGSEAVENITLESRLKDDLGFDSLNMFELCVKLEGALKTHISNNMDSIKTVGDIVTQIKENKNVPSNDTEFNIEKYPLLKTKKHLWWLKAIMLISRNVWHIKAFGLENIPSDGRYILCPNHQSHFDGLWIWSAISSKRMDLSKICCLAKQEHLDSKLSHYVLTLLGGIPVDRSGNTVPAMKRALSCINAGYTMLIHPEGTRTLDGNIQEFKGGAVKLAIDAGVPVIPVRIEGAWHIFPAHRKLPKIFRFGKRYPIKITFCKPITPKGESVDELAALLQCRVMRMGEVV